MRRGSPRWSGLSVGRRSSSSCLKGGGRIDLLVNNAGIGLLGGAEESSTQQAQALFDVNVFGVLRVTNAVLPIMRRQKQGRIINLSSLLGLIPAPYSALYAATKHAIEGSSESLDHELRTWGSRVVLVELAISRNECLNWLFPKGYAVAIGSSAIAGASEFRAALVVVQAAPQAGCVPC